MHPALCAHNPDTELVPSSLCRRTLARCFSAAPHALSLVSTWIRRYQRALSPWASSLAFHWTHNVSAGKDFISIPSLSRRGKTTAIRCSLAWSPWGDCPWVNWNVRRLPVGRLTVHLRTLVLLYSVSLRFDFSNLSQLLFWKRQVHYNVLSPSRTG